MNTQPRNKLKNAGKGWNRSLKTWLALDQARGGNAAAVFRDELRNPRVGCFPEQLGLSPLNRSLRGSTAWWAKGR